MKTKPQKKKSKPKYRMVELWPLSDKPDISLAKVIPCEVVKQSKTKIQLTTCHDETIPCDFMEEKMCIIPRDCNLLVFKNHEKYKDIYRQLEDDYIQIAHVVYDVKKSAQCDKIRQIVESFLPEPDATFPILQYLYKMELPDVPRECGDIWELANNEEYHKLVEFGMQIEKLSV